MLESAEGHLQLAAALSAEMEELEQAEIDNADGRATRRIEWASR